MFRLFDLCKTAAGFHDTYHEKQHQQGVTDSLKSAVDTYHYIPDCAAFEVLRRLRDQLPDLAQLSIPDLQRILKILDYPIIRHSFRLLWGRSVLR